MINIYEVAETNKMITEENLDVRTITLGISLLDCIDSDLQRLNEKIYTKIYEAAKDLVKTGEEISREFGIPIVNKRISVTPIALIGGAACKTTEDFASVANDGGGRAADSLYPAGPFCHRARMLLRESGLYQDWHQYGRREAHGRNHQIHRGAYQRGRLSGLRKVSGIL